MVRVPWVIHPQAAKRATSKLVWRPGLMGTGQQPITATPIGAYTRVISGVPLVGGQAQGLIPGINAFSGSSTSPGAIHVIALGPPIPVAGSYVVNWSVTLAGTVGAGDANNVQLYLNTSPVATSVNAGAAGTYPQAPVTVNVLAPGQNLSLVTIGAGTAGSVYSGSVSQTSVSLSLSVAPQGLGTTWYPAQVTLSTTTGLNDTAVADVYLGPAVTPATLVAPVPSGNGVAALAIPWLQPGQTLVTVWTGGTPGDTAAMNVGGIMSALGVA